MKGMPRVLIAGGGYLLQQNVVALGAHGHQAQPAGTVSFLGTVRSFGGLYLWPNACFLAAGSHDGLLTDG